MRVKAMLLLAAFSLSIGMGLISGGIGGVAPSVRNVALPLVCQGELTRETSPFSYKPGQSGISRTTYCVDRSSGARRDITLALVVVAGLIYSAMVFACLFLLARVVRRRLTA